jgi:hypothetical protein
MVINDLDVQRITRVPTNEVSVHRLAPPNARRSKCFLRILFRVKGFGGTGKREGPTVPSRLNNRLFGLRSIEE